MEKVLCVCLGNISRSPMMQAVLQQQLGAGFRVESAGVSKAWAGRPANHRSVACMRCRARRADAVRSALCADPARVMVANAHQGGIPDPYELGLADYRDCLALLDQVMPHVAQRISAASFASPNGR